MKIGNIDIAQKVLIVAEIGNNHEGNLDVAERMIHAAADCGVDAVKFQTFRTENYVSQSDANRFRRLKSFELTPDQFRQLAMIAKRRNVMFLSTPFDLVSARLINELCPAMKIASGDNTFVPLLETVASFGKPILVSTGLSDLSRVKAAVECVKRVWQSRGYEPGLVLLHCVSAYPTPAEQANLGAIQSLKTEVDCALGYSDHTLGTDAAGVAVALGARVIEKHFTLDKNYSDFRDHQISSDPPEMAQLVVRVRLVEKLIGDGRKQLQPAEESTALATRRCIVSSRNLPQGAVIQWEDLNWVRGLEGLCPGEESKLLGRMTKQDVSTGTPLTAANIG